MFYFVNEYLLSRNSSIEHVEFKRAKLFKEKGVEGKIVTRNYDPILPWTIKKFGITGDQVQNMFDFFAGTTDLEETPMRIPALNVPIDYQVGRGNNFREVMEGGRHVSTIHFAPGSIAQIGHIEYFDPAGNITRNERYDIRGFKGCDQFFDFEGNIIYETYYRPDGTRYMERHFIKSTENTPINSMNRLINYRGYDREFPSYEALFAYFLDELNIANGEGNTFIADRPAVANEPVMNMKSKAKKYLWLPMNHARDGYDILTGAIDPSYNEAFLPAGEKKLDGLLVMTDAQRETLLERLKPYNKIYTISGAIADEVDRVAQTERTPGKIVYVGRLGMDKQIDQLLTIFKQIHTQLPASSLSLYGYGSKEDTDKFNKQVEDLKFDNPETVKFEGYLTELDEAYNQAQLLIDASRIDGQPVAMVEALSHGVPAIAYDISFGPSEIIKDGENGRLIELNNSTAMANAAIEILSDPDKLQKLSDGAYETSTKFSKDAAWEQWQQIVK